MSTSEPETTPRLVWSTQRHGQDLRISVVPPRDVGDRGFHAVDAEAAAGEDPGSISNLIRSVSEKVREPDVVALQRFRAQPSAGPPMMFVLLVSLGDGALPKGKALESNRVSSCELAGVPGIRIHGLATPKLGRGFRKSRLEVFTAIYMAETPSGLLTLDFATPHVMEAPEFSILFDTIATSSQIEPA